MRLAAAVIAAAVVVAPRNPSVCTTVSDDGSHVFFSTSESLVSGDTDTDEDIYERSAGLTTLPAAGSNSAYRSISSDGTQLFVVTGESLAATDTDSAADVYRFSGGTPIQQSIGSSGGNDNLGNATFNKNSSDGSRVFFTTADRLEPNDVDSAADIYERFIDLPGVKSIERIAKINPARS